MLGCGQQLNDSWWHGLPETRVSTRRIEDNTMQTLNLPGSALNQSTVKIDESKKQVVVTIPYGAETDNVNASGKTYPLANSGGNQSLGIVGKHGFPIKLGFNMGEEIPAALRK
jgi:hypothetical protein